MIETIETELEKRQNLKENETEESLV